MSKIQIAHIAAETVVVGGLSIFFSMKLKALQRENSLLRDKLADCEQQLQEQNSQIKRNSKLIRELFQRGDKLVEEASSLPVVAKEEFVEEVDVVEEDVADDDMLDLEIRKELEDLD